MLIYNHGVLSLIHYWIKNKLIFDWSLAAQKKIINHKLL
jgi:hypothetical protein